MKKTLFVIGIIAVLISMPAMTAFPTTDKIPNFPRPEKTLYTAPAEDYDGTFIGGIGEIYKDESGEWAYDVHAYLAGVYRGGKYKLVLGHIYNLDEEQIGSIGFVSGNHILVGKVRDMNEEEAPIVGFLFYQDNLFIGRIMSFFGPAPHIFGEYTPN
jgi:hypothetical protein